MNTLLALSFGLSWGGTIACALGAFMSGVAINSAWADRNKLNTALYIAGIAFFGLLIFFVYSLTKVTN